MRGARRRRWVRRRRRSSDAPPPAVSCRRRRRRRCRRAAPSEASVAGAWLLSWRLGRRRRAGVVGVVVVVRVGCGVRRSPGAVRGAAQTEVGALREVEDLACFEAPVHHLVAVHVVAEEVSKVDEVVAVLVELGRGGGAQAPVGASAAGLRHRGHEDRVSVACVNHPDGLVLHEVDVGGREADLFAHFSERGCVRRFADFRRPPKSCQKLPARPSKAPCRQTTKTLAPEKVPPGPMPSARAACGVSSRAKPEAEVSPEWPLRAAWCP